MKFFDPKKKDQNSSAYPPPASTPAAPSPVVQPAPLTPTPSATPGSPATPANPATQTSPVTPTSLPRPPAQVPAEATIPFSVSADTAPTVMVPIPQAQPPAPPVPAPAVVSVPEPPPAPPQKPALVTQRLGTQPLAQTVIGSTVMIKGDLTANESIVVDGFVEGAIETTGDVHVGMHGKVYASVRADNIKISGKVVGNVTAPNKVELDSTAVLEGNIRAPRLSISESALFRGSIDMRPVPSKETTGDQEKEKKSTSSASLEPA